MPKSGLGDGVRASTSDRRKNFERVSIARRGITPQRLDQKSTALPQLGASQRLPLRSMELLDGSRDSLEDETTQSTV
jgi:hypothetical protein